MMNHKRKRYAAFFRPLLAALLATGAALSPTGLAAGTRDAVLQWLPPAGVVDGYRVRLGGAPSLYSQILDLGVVPVDPDGIGRATLTLDSDTDYYIAVSAYNDSGESPRSNEIVIAASACDPSGCDDAQQCTADDCGPEGCTHAALPDGTFCSAASSAYGMCMAGACQAAQCTEAAHCDDGNACNGTESCGLGGVCTRGKRIRCGAASKCAVPTCDPVSGGCREVPRREGERCDDGLSNTKGDVCRLGVCRGKLRN